MRPYEYKLQKGQIMQGSVPEGRVKKKWVAVGQVCRARGPGGGKRDRKGWVFNLEVDGLRCSAVHKSMKEAKEEGFSRALKIATFAAVQSLPFEVVGDMSPEDGEPHVLVELASETPENEPELVGGRHPSPPVDEEPGHGDGVDPALKDGKGFSTRSEDYDERLLDKAMQWVIDNEACIPYEPPIIEKLVEAFLAGHAERNRNTGKKRRK